MRVLVVGGNGFIGSHVVDVLLDQDIDVVVFDRHPERFRTPLPRVSYVVGDLNDPVSLENAISQGVDSVVHLASSTSPVTSNDNPLSDLENISGAIRLLDLCLRRNIKRIVYASSGGTVYGIPKILPIPEDHSTEPICSYGIAKLAIEKYLHASSYRRGLATVVLRIGNPYGVRQSSQSAQGVVPIFVSQAIQGKPLTVWGDGSVVRDFFNVRDLARLFLLALTSDATGIFNAGSGVGTSISDLLELISTHLGVRPQINRKDSRKCDVPAIVLDCRKARTVYGWEPRVTLAEGLTECSHWLNSMEPKPVAICR
jgi:UDP-glucose 4-epimerase